MFHALDICKALQAAVRSAKETPDYLAYEGSQADVFKEMSNVLQISV
jgi:hypothetical protein